MCHLRNTSDPNDSGIFESVSRLGGGVWADTVIRRGVSARVWEWLGDGATDAVVEVAAKPVMDYWRRIIQPALFPSGDGDGDDPDGNAGDDDKVDGSYMVPVAPGITYSISKYVAPGLVHMCTCETRRRAWGMSFSRRIANNVPFHSRENIDAAYDKSIRTILDVISELFDKAHAKGASPQVGSRPGLGLRPRYDAYGQTGTDVKRKRESS